MLRIESMRTSREVGGTPTLVQVIGQEVITTGPSGDNSRGKWVNILRPEENGHHFPDDIFKYIFLNENVWILIKISLYFVSNGSINNIQALVQIMAWCQPGDKPLSEPMMAAYMRHSAPMSWYDTWQVVDDVV